MSGTTTPAAIDANVYWFPEHLFTDDALLARFVECARDASGMSTRVLRTDAGVEIVVEKPEGSPNLNYRQGEYELDRILADLDRAGIAQAVLKLPGCQQWLDLDLCRRFNDGLADYQRRSDGRLVGLACVPPDAGDAGVAELRRCREQLGLAGLQLASHYGEDYLDSPRFSAFFEVVNERPTAVYVHHAPTPVDAASLEDFTNLRRSYGRCVEQATAVGREVFSGFFDRFPNISVVHSMLGGAFYSVIDLMLPSNAGGKGRFQDAARLRKTLREHVWFEMSHAQPWGSAQLGCAIQVLGADRVVYGSSYPVNEAWFREGIPFIASLGLSDQDLDAVLHDNAVSLYGLVPDREQDVA